MSILNFRLPKVFGSLRLLTLLGVGWHASVELALAQSPVSKPEEPKPFARALGVLEDSNRLLERRFLLNLVKDQKTIWTSPFHIKKQDSLWLIPTLALTGEFVHRDVYLHSRLAQGDGATSARFSNAGLAGFGAIIGTSFLLGHVRSDAHARETGILGAQSAINSLAVTYALKYSLRRQRPLAGDGRGSFFKAGGDAESFPSGHAMLAWSVAAVIAHEYPGKLTKLGAYGLAGAISMARVTGRKHFPADILVGSALGWAIGRHVYKQHHAPSLPGEDIGTFRNDSAGPSLSSSPYVPLDSWVYPAIQRLSAWGFVQSDFLGMRPWTRKECARLVSEADEIWHSGVDFDLKAEGLIKALRDELRENSQDQFVLFGSTLRMESAYSRTTGIVGTPLGDGYHFGQTMTNDEGRPLGEGFNAVVGISGSATRGRWSAYVRGEYQHVPFLRPLPLSAQAEISRVDATSTGGRSVEQNRFRLMEAYLSFSLSEGWAITGGKQSLWWAPNEGGSLNFSNNAEPILMLKIARIHPMVLPLFLHYLGPVRAEFFLGQLQGHEFAQSTAQFFGPGLSRQPLIDGGKVSFKPTKNLEFGLSFTTTFGGPGFPLNFKSFIRTLTLNNSLPGEPNDPGDRRAGFDFRYRIPKLRKWLTVYNDSMTEDEISPIGYPRRSAMSPGIHLAAVPRIPNLELKAEGFYTDLPGLRSPGSYYYNVRFLSGFTNYGNLLGHAVGRQGRGFLVVGSYWVTPTRRFRFGYKYSAVSPEFIQGGGKLRDFWVGADLRVKDLRVEGRVQLEGWKFPIMEAQSKRNVMSSFQITYRRAAK